MKEEFAQWLIEIRKKKNNVQEDQQKDRENEQLEK